MRAAPIAITIVAPVLPAAAAVGLFLRTLVGRTRTMRTCGVVANPVAGSCLVAGVTARPPIRRTRYAQ